MVYPFQYRFCNEHINIFGAKERIFKSKNGSHLSLTVTNPPSFGVFPKIKKQLVNKTWQIVNKSRIA